MSNIVDYLKWRGDLTFSQSPFNHVDNLILSKLSYLDFREVINPVHDRIGDLAKHYLDHKGFEKIGLFLNEEFPELLRLMGECRRFSNLAIRHIVDVQDDEKVVQFAAMAIELDEITTFLAFRGTDDSLVGWKEDFQMSIMDVVPAQIEALRYVEGYHQLNPTKKLLLGGHSKGGNLAVYAAIHGSESLKMQLVAVYNNDGPGFKESVLETQNYKSIKDKVITLAPQSSVIGMLLEHEEDYLIVRSKGDAIMQHDGFNWFVEGADFLYIDELGNDSKIFSKTIKSVLNDLSIEQREVFTNVFFSVLASNERRRLLDFEKDHVQGLMSMLKTYGNIDPKTRKAVKDTLGLFFQEGLKNYREMHQRTSLWDSFKG